MNDPSAKTLRLFTGISLLSALVLVYRLYLQAEALGLVLVSRRWTVGLAIMALFILVLAAISLAAWLPVQERLMQALRQLSGTLSRFRPLLFVLFIVSILAFSLLILGRYGVYFLGIPERLATFWLAVLINASLLKLISTRHSWIETLAFSALMIGVVYEAALLWPNLSTYPFSMGWSETSRFYYASLYFGNRIYGVDTLPTVLHPSRYLLQAIPFLVSGLPLWFHRLWQVLLWIAIPLATSAALAARLSISDRFKRWIFIFWAFLFMFQGPVYYHLLVCVLIVTWGFDSRRVWKSTAVVLVASIWAGISRVNWIPMPGLLAASLYFLEVRTGRESWWRYPLKPLLWFASGSLAGVASQFLYALWSGNELEQFGSSFTSDLLWYRLFPNPTYPEGVLPSILVLSLPVFLLIAWHLLKERASYHPIRLLGLASILAVLFAGGLLVSVKIGGGNNLHNLDGYLFILMVVAAYVYFGQTQQETELASWAGIPHPAVTALVLLAPLLYALQLGGPFERPDFQQAQEALQQLRQRVQETAQEGGEVLFMSERHLLTFNMVTGVRLIPEYERTFLMEMAMANNQEYLGRFRQELAQHRFDLIVTQPLYRQYKGWEYSFGEENDAFVRWVSEPVLCYYEIDDTIKEISLQFLVPRAELDNCAVN